MLGTSYLTNSKTHSVALRKHRGGWTRIIYRQVLSRALIRLGTIRHLDAPLFCRLYRETVSSQKWSRSRPLTFPTLLKRFQDGSRLVFRFF